MTQEKVIRGMISGGADDGYIGSQRLAKRVGEEEATRPCKTDIDVALAAAPSGVTQGQVSDGKLNKQAIVLPLARSCLNQGCVHRLAQRFHVKSLRGFFLEEQIPSNRQKKTSLTTKSKKVVSLLRGCFKACVSFLGSVMYVLIHFSSVTSVTLGSQRILSSSQSPHPASLKHTQQTGRGGETERGR